MKKNFRLWLSALSLGAVAITIPVAMTSCGTSYTNNGGSEETKPSDTSKTTDFKWNTWDSSISGVSVGKDNVPTITLGTNAFDGTTINSNSTYDQIIQSLQPSTESNTLYSVLSKHINDINNADVTLNVSATDVSFNYINSQFGNTLTVSYTLTPKSESHSSTTENNNLNNNHSEVTNPVENNNHSGDSNNSSSFASSNTNNHHNNTIGTSSSTSNHAHNNTNGTSNSSSHNLEHSSSNSNNSSTSTYSNHSESANSSNLNNHTSIHSNTNSFVTTTNSSDVVASKASDSSVNGSAINTSSSANTNDKASSNSQQGSVSSVNNSSSDSQQGNTNGTDKSTNDNQKSNDSNSKNSDSANAKDSESSNSDKSKNSDNSQSKDSNSEQDKSNNNQSNDKNTDNKNQNDSDSNNSQSDDSNKSGNSKSNVSESDNTNNTKHSKTLTFVIKNFNDATNQSKSVYWNEAEAKKVLEKNKLETTGYKLNSDSSILTVNLSSNLKTSEVLKALHADQDSNQLTKEQVKKMIQLKDGASSKYDLNNMDISFWGLSSDYSKAFTRVVIPTTDNSKYATLYIEYTGFSKDSAASADFYCWNRNALKQIGVSTQGLKNSNGKTLKGYTAVVDLSTLKDNPFASAGVTTNSSLKSVRDQLATTGSKFSSLLVNDFTLNMKSNYRVGLTPANYIADQSKSLKIGYDYSKGNAIDASFRLSNNKNRYASLVLTGFGSKGY